MPGYIFAQNMQIFQLCNYLSLADSNL